jgi:hypothetical protein
MSDNGLQVLALGGNSWGDNRGATAIAFGVLNNQEVVGVTRSAGNNARFEIYSWNNGLQLLALGGNSWGDNRGATAIAFGILNNQKVVGVTRSAGDHDRFEIYKWRNGLEMLTWGGTDWGSSREGTGIAFGLVNGEGVVCVSRNGSDHAEVFCYKYINNELVAYATKGVDWGDERGATCIAFGTLNDDLVVGYGRNRGNHNRGGILKWV